MNVVAFRNEGNGMFRCLHPKKVADIDIGAVHGWQLAEHRSPESHKHFFAIIHEVWLSLPEHLADEFPNDTALRKWALIKAGFCTVSKVVCANNTQALTLVATVKHLDSYAVVEVSDKVVTIYTADSQKNTAQGRAEFQAAKEGALNAVSRLVGADVTAMGKAA